MADRTNQQLGNYRLVQLLGRGGFAEVYLAEHRHLGTEAAIKVLYAKVSNTEEGDFLREARTLAHLEHPHIVRILDFDVQDGTPFLVMGYAPNGTMRNRYPKGTRLPLPMVIEYSKQVAAALQYAHEKNIIHRDIKPENILLGRHTEILLSDFGIAQIAQSSRLVGAQEVVGTAAYMAPEQLQGKPRLASDQYSLAIVIYEWLSGERPFHGTFMEVFSQQLSTPPAPLHTKIRTISPEIDQVILTALAKEPTQRFGSVKAFVTALEQASPLKSSYPSNPSLRAVTRPAESPLPPTPPPVGSPPPQTLHTPRVTRPVESSLPPTPPPVGPPPPQTLHTPHAALDSGHASQVTDLPMTSPPAAFSAPSQQRVPREVPNTPLPLPIHTDSMQSPADDMQSPNVVPVTNSVPAIQVEVPRQRRGISRRKALIGLTTLALVGGGTWAVLSRWPFIIKGTPPGPPKVTASYIYKGHTRAVDAVAWSPDGKRIASSGDDGTIQVWNATDGSSLYTYPGHSNAVNAVAWSPDGKRIASASADGTVQVWNAADGSSPYIYRGHSVSVLTVAWSPDGTRIASGSTDNTVQVWNATDGSSPYTYKGHSRSVNKVAWSPDGTRIASGGDDNTVQVWNATDGSSPYTYKGHSGPVHAVAWSPNGKRIASGSDDSTVQVWNATDGSSPSTYSVSNPVLSVAWSPDGKRIALGSADNTVQIWPGS